MSNNRLASAGDDEVGLGMRHVRIRVELNKGRVGMPLDKMAAIARDTVDFLGSLTRDLGLEEPAHAWLAERFDNGSVDFDCRFAVPLEEARGLGLRSAMRMVFANDYSDATTAMLIRPETRRRYARIARPLDADEVARFGIYQDGTVDSIEWFTLSAALAAEIEEPLAGSHRSYGEVQGIVHAFFKEAEKPYLKIRELSSQQLVNCYFPKELYRNAVEVLADPEAVVFVEGWTTESAETGFISEVEVADFRLAPEFRSEVYHAGLGSQPGFTGGIETTDYIREVRGE
jgi:hypothetical protein